MWRRSGDWLSSSERDSGCGDLGSGNWDLEFLGCVGTGREGPDRGWDGRLGYGLLRVSVVRGG